VCLKAEDIPTIGDAPKVDVTIFGPGRDDLTAGRKGQRADGRRRFPKRALELARSGQPKVNARGGAGNDILPVGAKAQAIRRALVLFKCAGALARFEIPKR